MPENDLPLLIDAAKAAGEIAVRYWSNAPKVWDKPNHQGPVTEADIAIDAMLREQLRAARPSYGWLSEETEDDNSRLTSEHVFIVDPLDGTRSFIEGGRAFAHVLAVVRHGEVTAAAIYLPLLDRLYTAAKGQGAFLNGAPITPSTQSSALGASLLAARPAMEARFWTGTPPAVDLHMRPSLAYRQCLVAQGRFDAMLTLRDSWDWDLAAGALILSEAGAQVTDRNGAPLRFNETDPHSPGILAAPPKLHESLLNALV